MKGKEQKENIIFIIDSGSVSVFAYKEDFQGNYRYLFSKKEYIDNTFDLENNFDILMQRFSRILLSFAEESQKRINPLFLKEITIIFSSPWIASQKRILHFEKKQEFIFSQNILEEILKKGEKETLLRTHDFKKYQKLTLVDQKVVAFYGNGYQVKDLIGKKIKELDLHVFASVMSQDTKDFFLHIIEKVFHREAKILNSNYLLYRFLDNSFHDKKDFLSFRLGAEITDIFLVENNKLEKIGSIPVGFHHIIRKLAQDLHIPFVKAESFILMYQNNNFDFAYKETLEPYMKKSFLIWLRPFYDFLHQLVQEHMLIPHHIIPVISHPMKKWFMDSFLESEEIREYMHLKKEIQILSFHDFLTKEKEKFNREFDDELGYILSFFEGNK